MRICRSVQHLAAEWEKECGGVAEVPDDLAATSLCR